MFIVVSTIWNNEKKNVVLGDLQLSCIVRSLMHPGEQHSKQRYFDALFFFAQLHFNWIFICLLMGAKQTCQHL